MDPYLERHWGDVHVSMLMYIRDALQFELPDGLIAQAEESIRVDTDDAEDDRSKWGKPDVSIIEDRETGPRFSVVDENIALAEPVLVTSQEKQRWLEIVDIDSGSQLVTAIEILSPANKSRPEGRDQYRERQRRYLQSRASFVEIDLLRRGEHILSVPQAELGNRARDFHVCVSRHPSPETEYRDWEVYPISIRDPLPNFRIPLRKTDSDVVLQLQPVLDKVYHNGCYGRKVNYTKPLSPPLEGDDAVWAKELLEERTA